MADTTPDPLNQALITLEYQVSDPGSPLTQYLQQYVQKMPPNTPPEQLFPAIEQAGKAWLRDNLFGGKLPQAQDFDALRGRLRGSAASKVRAKGQEMTAEMASAYDPLARQAELYEQIFKVQAQPKPPAPVLEMPEEEISAAAPAPAKAAPVLKMPPMKIAGSAAKPKAAPQPRSGDDDKDIATGALRLLEDISSSTLDPEYQMRPGGRKMRGPND